MNDIFIFCHLDIEILAPIHECLEENQRNVGLGELLLGILLSVWAILTITNGKEFLSSYNLQNIKSLRWMSALMF